MPSLPNRPDVLFGRQPDLDHLHARTATRGITAVVGRPQLGKSWLLAEFAHQLAEQDGGPLVGYAASKGGEPQLLLRAAKNLYENWLADETRLKRAKHLWSERKGDFGPAVANAVASVIKTADPTGISGAVHEAFDTLVAGGGTQEAGGPHENAQLPVLQYDQARDLVRAAAETSGRPVVLILDQWDESLNVQHEAKLLAHMLRDLEEWPTCRVVVGIRSETEAAETFEREVRSLRPGLSERYHLGFIDVEDAAERTCLLGYLLSNVPATQHLPPETLLHWIGGNPAVVQRWRDAASTATPDSLEQLAHDAHCYMYRELDAAIPALQRPLQGVSMRLALLPMAGNEEMWPTLAPIVLGDQDESCLDDLRAQRVLVAQGPPNFGHSRRWEAAWTCMLRERTHTARLELKSLSRILAAHIQSISASNAICAAALFNLVVRI